MEETPCQNNIGMPHSLALKWKSPFHNGLLILSFISMHFLNPYDMRCLLGLWGAEEKEEFFSSKEFECQINWTPFHICVEFMKES